MFYYKNLFDYNRVTKISYTKNQEIANALSWHIKKLKYGTSTL